MSKLLFIFSWHSIQSRTHCAQVSFEFTTGCQKKGENQWVYVIKVHQKFTPNEIHATHILFQTCHTIYMHASYDPYMTSPLFLFSKTIKFCTEVHMMLVCIPDNEGSFIKRDTSLSDPE